MSTPKVSVVIAAYCPGEGFRRVVHSLAAQTLPQDEFEVIVIDDGSPDDTWTMLQRVRDERSNYRIERIENSGWPSRPRNIGIEMAAGEYVLFMDHDDSVFPDGLRAAYEYAKANDADVVSAKELKTSDSGFGLGNFTKDVPNAYSKGINCLLPMMPHKLYRRQMLLDHGVRFPENRKALWEDVAFNVAAYRHSKVISILASTPVYLWHKTESNNSATYGPWEAHFWNSLDRLYEFIDATFDTPEFAEAKRSQFLHHYRIRTVGRIRGMLLAGERTAAEERFAIERGRQNLERFIPATWDERLNHTDRIYGHLIRNGQLDALRDLVTFDASFEAVSTLTDQRRHGTSFTFTTEARWTGKNGAPLPLRRDGDRIFRSYPDKIGDAVPTEITELTGSALKPMAILTLRNGATSMSLKVPSSRRVTFTTFDPARPHLVTPVIIETGTIDTSALGMGAALSEGVWQLRAHNVFCGMRTDAKIHYAPTITIKTASGITSFTTTVADEAFTQDRLFPWCDVTVPLPFLDDLASEQDLFGATVKLHITGGREPLSRFATRALQWVLDRAPGRITRSVRADGGAAVQVRMRAVRGIHATLHVEVPGIWSGTLGLVIPAQRGSAPVIH